MKNKKMVIFAVIIIGMMSAMTVVGWHNLRQTETGAKIECDFQRPFAEAQHNIMGFVMPRMGWPKPKMRLPATCQ